MNDDISTQFEKYLQEQTSPPQTQKQWDHFLQKLRETWQVLEIENYQLKKSNSQDSLTGLLNFKSFHTALEKSAFCHESLALIMLDIDDFKGINKDFGHFNANKLLVMLAKLLKQELPMSGLIGRFGGDEFLIAFPCSSKVEMKSYAFLLLDKIRQSRFSLGQKRIHLHVSLGMTLINHHQYINQAFEEVDKSLGLAKLKGKDQFHFYENREFNQVNR